jgi:hypothetical protein
MLAVFSRSHYSRSKQDTFPLGFNCFFGIVLVVEHLWMNLSSHMTTMEQFSRAETADSDVTEWRLGSGLYAKLLKDMKITEFLFDAKTCLNNKWKEGWSADHAVNIQKLFN